MGELIPMKTIQDVLSCTTAELAKDAITYLLKYYPKAYYSGDNFVYAPGTSPICLVAHMDTARDLQVDPASKIQRHSFNMGKPFNLVQTRNVLRNATGILGADDRAGVFGCFEVMRRCKRDKLPMPSIILTNGEESGGKGVGVFVATKAFELHDKDVTRLFIEMDRQGCNDWVTYGPTLPNEVSSYLESFGFISSRGSYSDCADLQTAYEIPGINLSIGYYSQHTDKERLHLDEMMTTINRVYNMVKDPIDALYKAPKKPVYNTPYYNNYENWTKDNYTKPYTAPNKTTVPTKADKELTNSEVSWLDKKGDAVIDAFLERNTQGGFCLECGFPWADCDEVECHAIIDMALVELSVDKLNILVSNYLGADDPMVSQLAEAILVLGELDIANIPDSADAFHVDADGTSLIDSK